MKILLLLYFGLVSVSTESPKLLEDFRIGTEIFSANLYTAIKNSNDGNFFVSSLSLQTILALERIGAKGETAKELSKNLYIPDNEEDIKHVFREVSKNWENTGDSNLASAIKVFIQNVKVDAAEQASATEFFNVEMERVDFKDKSAVSKINGWVSKNTYDQDNQMISPNSIDSTTQSIHISLLYFKGFWQNKFEDRATKSKHFFISPSEKKEIPIMMTSGTYKYAYNERLKAQFLQLPCKGSDMSMIIVLPDEIDGLSKLELKINEVFTKQNYYQPNVTVQIPKFMAKSTILLNQPLKDMGIQKIFEDEGSDEKPFKISAVNQKAIIEVDEEGGRPVPPKPGEKLVKPIVEIFIDFNANRPFIYYVKSEAVGVLFIGRFTNP